jgi:hypothetical protein
MTTTTLKFGLVAINVSKQVLATPEKDVKQEFPRRHLFVL